MPQLNVINSVSDIIKSDVQYSYNCGILSFKDWALFEAYNKFISDIISLYHSDSIIKNFYNNNLNFYERMLVVEQYSLPVIVKKMNKVAKFIINNYENIQFDCDFYGFAHAFGKVKYSDSFQNQIVKKNNELDEKL